jgi:FG-GAP-like repeat/FG-GAP repeat
MKLYIQTLFLLLALCTGGCTKAAQQNAAQNFVIASSPHVSAEPITVCAADVNGDGKVDLIYGSHNGAATSALAVLTNNGSGGFATSVTYGLGRPDDHGMLIGSLICLTTADVNGDGMVDLIYGSSDGLTVLTNNGTGSFATSGTYGLGSLLGLPAYASGRVPSCLTTADVNGDGKVDLICGDQDGLTVLTNNGSGGFVIASLFKGNFPTSICAADVNGDGRMDLICAHQGEFNLTVLTNDGSGGFVLTSTLKIHYPTCLCAADVNGDGKVDLISGSQIDGALTVLTNNGNGGFVFASTLPVKTGPVSVIAADINGDGKVDLISANFNSSTLSILMNNGSGDFARASTVTLKENSNPQSVCAADVNGDGKLDLITANFNSSTLTVLTNSSSVADVKGSKGVSP